MKPKKLKPVPAAKDPPAKAAAPPKYPYQTGSSSQTKLAQKVFFKYGFPQHLP